MESLLQYDMCRKYREETRITRKISESHKEGYKIMFYPNHVLIMFFFGTKIFADPHDPHNPCQSLTQTPREPTHQH